jgi:hypothetical protein
VIDTSSLPVAELLDRGGLLYRYHPPGAAPQIDEAAPQHGFEVSPDQFTSWTFAILGDQDMDDPFGGDDNWVDSLNLEVPNLSGSGVGYESGWGRQLVAGLVAQGTFLRKPRGAEAEALDEVLSDGGESEADASRIRRLRTKILTANERIRIDSCRLL